MQSDEPDFWIVEELDGGECFATNTLESQSNFH